MPESGKNVYHGWITVDRERGYRDTFRCESTVNGEMQVHHRTKSAADAVEWWDKKVGQRVSLLDTPIGAYRVYTIAPRRRQWNTLTLNTPIELDIANEYRVDQSAPEFVLGETVLHNHIKGVYRKMGDSK
jgi:hypothetical protein